MYKETSDDRQYEELLKTGIAAVKAGNQEQARRLLEKATRIKTTDARGWIWLSGATEDLLEKRKFLEYAVAAEPGNATARRGLMMLSDKLDKTRLVAEGEMVQPRRPVQPEEALNEVFQCPNCGAKLTYEIQSAGLVCQHCGFKRAVEKIAAADSGEQPLDFVLATTRAHRWAEAQQRVSCIRCGAVSLLPPGQAADHCAYCGSNRIVAAAESGELVDPHVIAPFTLAEKKAGMLVKEWFGQGITTPDDLAVQAKALHLHPVYFPFWTFDGAVELPYTCQVKKGSGSTAQWVALSGVIFELFDDILVSGAKALSPAKLTSIEPFRLKEVVAFKPEFLAGWPAISYDRTLAEASLLAREKVIARVRPTLSGRIEPGSEKRDIQTGGGKWSGMTYKYSLLPLWLGSYRYRDKTYSILVNGQTGKVGGEKPHDHTKVFLLAGIGVSVILLLALLLWQFFYS